MTHYRKSKEKTLCGLIIRRRVGGKLKSLPTTKDFGEVGCATCNVAIRNAGLKALGIRP